MEGSKCTVIPQEALWWGPAHLHPSAWPDLLDLSFVWAGREGRYWKTVFILLQFHNTYIFLCKQNSVAYYINLASMCNFSIGAAPLFREPSLHSTKSIEKNKQTKSKMKILLFLCCLGTRPSGAGAAVQKHHSNGSDKLHPQLPQGKRTIADDYCEDFLKVTVSFEWR